MLNHFKRRIESLDALRGIAALGVMLYHLLSWEFGHFNSDSFWGRIGIFGVSIFYVLSGLTLYYVYGGKNLFSGKILKKFWKRRILRIFPLLWVVSATGILLNKLEPEIWDILLNFSGLFGFFRWDTTFSTGVWSIGNELVFYSAFPIIVMLTRSKWLFSIFLGSVLALDLIFGLCLLTPRNSLLDQWHIYTNPLNQILLFSLGIAISFYLRNQRVSNIYLILILLLASIVFIYYPVQGDRINLITGPNRYLFLTLCLVIVFAVYKLNLSEKMASNYGPLRFLGDISYSIYLLHPLVYFVVSAIVKRYLHSNAIITVIASVMITLLVGFLSYRLFESFFIRMGRKK